MTREEAIEMLRNNVCNSHHVYDNALPTIIEALEILIPELTESEDERIIKKLQEYVKNRNWSLNGPTQDEVLAWLERQKAKKQLDRMAPIYNNKESFESALEKAWKYYNESASRTVDSFEDDYIECVFSKGFREGFLYKEKQKEQKPAEKLFKEEYVKKFKVLCDAYEIKLPDREYDIYGLCKDLHKLFGDIQNPAEWSEQYIAGIFEKVGLAKIVREQGNDDLTNALQNAMFELSKVGNTGWSEEDENKLHHVIENLVADKTTAMQKNPHCKVLHRAYDELIDWLKSLPERFNLQSKQEWSEEDVKFGTREPRDNWEYIKEFCDKFGRMPKDMDELDVLVSYVMDKKHKEEKQIVQWPNLSNCKHDCKTCFAKCIYRKEQNEKQKPEPKQAPWTPKFKAGDLFKCNGMSQEAKIYEIKRIEKHGCVTGYWCAQFDTPMNGNVWFSSFEEEYMKPYAPELKEENPAKQNDAAINDEPIPAENQSVDIPLIEWSEEDETRLKVIGEELERYIMFKQYGTPLSVDDLDWFKSLPERFNLQPKQEVPKDAETLTAKLVNLLKSYRIGEKTAVDLADRIADTYGVQRYLDGVCDTSKQEWSEEDERMLRRCIKSVESSKNFADSQTFKEAKDKEKEWLISLPERFNLYNVREQYPIEDCDYGLEIAYDILEKTLGKVRGYQTDDGIREHQTAIKAVKDAMEEQKMTE